MHEERCSARDAVRVVRASVLGERLCRCLMEHKSCMYGRNITE